MQVTSAKRVQPGRVAADVTTTSRPVPSDNAGLPHSQSLPGPDKEAEFHPQSYPNTLPEPSGVPSRARPSGSQNKPSQPGPNQGPATVQRMQPPLEASFDPSERGETGQHALSAQQQLWEEPPHQRLEPMGDAVWRVRPQEQLMGNLQAGSVTPAQAGSSARVVASQSQASMPALNMPHWDPREQYDRQAQSQPGQNHSLFTLSQYLRVIYGTRSFRPCFFWLHESSHKWEASSVLAETLYCVAALHSLFALGNLGSPKLLKV